MRHHAPAIGDGGLGQVQRRTYERHRPSGRAKLRWRTHPTSHGLQCQFVGFADS
jgi:hypothetical protein